MLVPVVNPERKSNRTVCQRGVALVGCDARGYSSRLLQQLQLPKRLARGGKMPFESFQGKLIVFGPLKIESDGTACHFFCEPAPQFALRQFTVIGNP